MAAADQRIEQLTGLDVFEDHAGRGTLPALLAALDEAAGALGVDPRAGVLRALHAALRLDLAFLVEHPEATFSCLYNRCAWHGAPQAGASFLPDRRPILREDLLLAVMTRWRARKDESGARWVRSLRPPEHGLQGALVEEYRGMAFVYLQRLRLAEGGRHVELLHGPGASKGPFAPRTWQRIVWDRGTGRRLEAGPVELLDEEVSPDGLRRVERRTWDGADLLKAGSGAVVGRLEISSSRNVGGVAHAQDGAHAALVGWDADDGGFLVVFDLRTCRPVLDLDVDDSLYEVALSPDGARVAASSSVETCVWDVRTKRLLLSLPLRHAALSFADDGRTLLTAESGVVRVWDTARAATALRGYRGGLSHAAFSPGGQRLVTGTWLADARTGAMVGPIEYRSPRPLVGGPPANAFVLGDERLVCLASGVEVWDARTGAPLLRDRARFYTHASLVAHAPDGARYAETVSARWSEKDDDEVTVSILATDTGARVATFTTAPVRCMAWSPDGRRIATGSSDGQVRIWSGADGSPVQRMAGHPGPVTGIAFVKGGACLVSGAEDDAERVWDVASGAQLLSRPFGEGDPRGTRTSDGESRDSRWWEASREAVEAVDRRLDEGSDPIPWRAEQRGGSTAFVDRSGAVVAWLPANDALVRHPREPVWAGGPVHVRLEGRSP